MLPAVSAQSAWNLQLSTTHAAFWRQGEMRLLTYGPDGQRRGEGVQVFVAAFAPRPRMLVFGAIGLLLPQSPRWQVFSATALPLVTLEPNL